MPKNELVGLLLNCYQSDQIESLLEIRDREIARLQCLTKDLATACEIALDALDCDRTRQDRLDAQRIIHDTVKKAEQ